MEAVTAGRERLKPIGLRPYQHEFFKKLKEEAGVSAHGAIDAAIPTIARFYRLKKMVNRKGEWVNVPEETNCAIA